MGINLHEKYNVPSGKIEEDGYITEKGTSVSQITSKKPPVSDNSSKTVRKTADEFLREGAHTFAERNKIYGDNYTHFGDAMVGLFPNGITLKSRDDFNRFGVLVQIVSKIGRYSNMFNQGGHADSLHDLSVYAAILQEIEQ